MEANAWARSAEGAELNDAVCSVLAHELGGIAGALDLRAAALSRTIPPNDVAALRGLAEEVRASTRAVRLLRGADASGTLNPAKEQSLADWWRLASKMSRVVLPRDATVNATFEEGRLPAPLAQALTWFWLSACKDLADNPGENPLSITLRGGQENGATVLRADIPAGVSPDSSSRWAKHAGEVATSIGVPAPLWKNEGGVVSWSVSLPGSPG
jgi:hypothetical protein